MLDNIMNPNFEYRFEPWDEEIECVITVVYMGGEDKPLYVNPSFDHDNETYKRLCGLIEFKFAIFDHDGNMLEDVMQWVNEQGKELEQEIFDMCLPDLERQAKDYFEEPRFAI
jgi:hypothetical protein